jgi:Spy/CpxP family protein refolding chaperone
MFVGVAILGLALLVGSGASQGTKKSTASLPSGWGKLGLSKEQKTKIYAIRGEYKVKIADLEQQLTELRSEETRKMVAVLSADQKDKLRKLAVGESTTPRTKDKDK